MLENNQRAGYSASQSDRTPGQADQIQIAATARVTPKAIQNYFRGHAQRDSAATIERALEKLGWGDRIVHKAVISRRVLRELSPEVLAKLGVEAVAR